MPLLKEREALAIRFRNGFEKKMSEQIEKHKEEHALS